MHRLRTTGAALLALAAAPALAQTRPAEPLARTADTFYADLSDLTRLATAAALVHERTGAFPADAFALLGSPEGGATGARRFALSELTATPQTDGLALRYVPLPTDPYAREDLVVTATVRPDGTGRYAVEHEMRRREDADDGGRAVLYDRAGVYQVERGFGRLCVDTEMARRKIADGSFVPVPMLFTASGDLTVRVHPPGEAAPVYYEEAFRTAP